MARVVVHLIDPEMNTLHRLAEREYRPARTQAMLIIRAAHCKAPQRSSGGMA